MPVHTLKWDAVPNAANYNVYKGQNVYQNVPTTQLDLTPLSNDGEIAGSTVLLSVSALKSDGAEGFRSEELVYSVPLPAPQNVRIE